MAFLWSQRSHSSHFLVLPKIRAQWRAAGHLAWDLSGRGRLQLACPRVASTDGGNWLSSRFSKPEAHWREFQLALQTVQLRKGKPVLEYRSFHTSQFTVVLFLLKWGESVSCSFLLTFLFYKGVRCGRASSSYIEVSCNMGILCMLFSMQCSLCKGDFSIKMYSVSGDGGDYLFCKVLQSCSKTMKKLRAKELDSAVSTGNYF